MKIDNDNDNGPGRRSVGEGGPGHRCLGEGGFTLIELLIVVAIIGLLAGIAVPGLLRARISGNEASAIGAMRTINSAQATFASSCGGGGYDVTPGADALGAEPVVGSPAFISQDLVDAFAGTPKSGYTYALTDGPAPQQVLAMDICDSGVPTSSQFFAQGDPDAPGVSGTRHFGVNELGQIRQDAAAQLADMTAGIPLN